MPQDLFLLIRQFGRLAGRNILLKPVDPAFFIRLYIVVNCMRTSAYDAGNSFERQQHSLIPLKITAFLGFITACSSLNTKFLFQSIFQEIIY
jgi:hypothetical protein